VAFTIDISTAIRFCLINLNRTGDNMGFVIQITDDLPTKVTNGYEGFVIRGYPDVDGNKYIDRYERKTSRTPCIWNAKRYAKRETAEKAIARLNLNPDQCQIVEVVKDGYFMKRKPV